MIVYVWGNLTADNFTPRPGRDTVGRAGQEPGLSAFQTPPAGRKSQGIDLDSLRLPLKAFFDKPDEGGTEGHVSIAPADHSGKIDAKALEEWVAFRMTGQVHPFTQIIFDAVVSPNFRSET